MALPPFTGSGLLPPGVHPATLAEIEAKFVEEAPSESGLRTAVMAGISASSLWSSTVSGVVPAGWEVAL